MGVGPPQITVHLSRERIGPAAPPVFTQVGDSEVSLNYRSVRFRVRGGDWIEITPRPHFRQSALSHFLLGPALGAALHQRGDLVLHASVVATGNSAAAFLGHSGSGKSTLAMAMVRAGARLLADDMAVIRFDNGSLRVMPGAGRARLSRNVAAVLGINPSLLHPIPGQRKRWLELDEARRMDQPCTLRTVYLLKRGTTVGTSFVHRRERLTSLLEFPFWAEMVSGAALPKFFSDCARVAQGTTVRTVARPLKLSHLQETAEMICAQMRAETG